MSKRILIFSRGNVGTFMSSPGIRAYAMARVLAKGIPDARITLAIPNETDWPEPITGVEVTTWGPMFSMPLIARHDIIITSGFSPHFSLFFKDKTFIADLFSQYYMEWMELTKAEARGVKREVWMSRCRAYIGMQLTVADFVICANERQRDSYIGMLSSLGLLDPAGYDADDTLRSLIDVAPHGIRGEPLTHDKRVVKGVYAGVRETDKLLLWNGGTVSWYDPEPFLRALHTLSKERDDIKALFLGTFYPGLGSFLGYGARFKSAFELAKELDLYQKSVFFEFGWVPHAEVKNYLLESDIGVCTYFENMETHYSHRTRFLDLFWAELPIICTRGDVLAADVEERQLGIAVPQGDASAIADAVRKLADDTDFYESCRANLRTLKPELEWEVTLDALVRFCRNGASTAAPKRKRFVPAMARTAEYVLKRVRDRATPNPT